MSIKIHERIANTNTMKRVINWAVPKDVSGTAKTNYDTLQKIWPTAFMLLTVGVAQTGVILNSDDMPKKRRIPLALNNVITCAISLLGVLVTDRYTDKLMNKFANRAKVIFKNEKQERMVNGIKTGMPILVSALLYKYIGQVLATPLADKVNKYLVKKEMVDYSKD